MKKISLIVILICIFNYVGYADRYGHNRRIENYHHRIPHHREYYIPHINVCYSKPNIVYIEEPIYVSRPEVVEYRIINNTYPKYEKINIDLLDWDGTIKTITIIKLYNGYYQGPKGEIYYQIPSIKQLRDMGY